MPGLKNIFGKKVEGKQFHFKSDCYKLVSARGRDSTKVNSKTTQTILPYYYTLDLHNP
jgi:hypothetical protein